MIWSRQRPEHGSARPRVISRGSAWFLVGFCVWNAFVWVTFVKNVFPEHHWDGFFLIHLGIGALTVAMGLVAGAIGVRALRA